MDAWDASYGSAPRSPGMLAVGEVPKRFFKPTDFQVMFANERMIVVAARWDHYALDLVVAHAPCNARHSAGNPSSESREWWREVRRTHSSKVSLVWMLAVVAFVETSVDLATVRPDHRLVACDFTLGHVQGGKWHDRRQCGYDRNAVQSDEPCTRFGNAAARSLC